MMKKPSDVVNTGTDIQVQHLMTAVTFFSFKGSHKLKILLIFNLTGYRQLQTMCTILKLLG